MRVLYVVQTGLKSLQFNTVLSTTVWHSPEADSTWIKFIWNANICLMFKWTGAKGEWTSEICEGGDYSGREETGLWSFDTACIIHLRTSDRNQ